jgi:HD superfamily phosphohydrolase YqeK
MSVAVSSSPAADGRGLSALAARGQLPGWACVGERRRAHIERVAALMDGWADTLGLPAAERERWLAAAWLHDALRDADPAELRPTVPLEFADAAGPLLHGPAAAERLRGLVDDDIEVAVQYHTFGHPAFGDLGRSLYLADFLEPGRDFLEDWRSSLRARMPAERGAVLIEVLAARIAHLLERRKPIRPETAAFWTAAVGAHA